MRPTVPFAAAVALLAVASSVKPASAQPQPFVPPQPVYSPYLNMLWGGGGPAFNYFALVQPQLQFQQQSAQLQYQLNRTNQAIQATNAALVAGADPYLPITGRGATFGYYSHYYPALSGGRFGGAAGRGFSSGFNRGGLGIGQAPSVPTGVGGYGGVGGVGSSTAPIVR